MGPLGRMLSSLAFVVACGLAVSGCGGGGLGGGESYAPDDPGIAGLDVRAIAVQPDGKVLIGGNFTSVRGVPRNNIARLETDGSLDMTFDPNVGGVDGFAPAGIFGLVVQPDGKVVIGGYFTSVGGTPRLHMARVNPDGTLDTGYDPHPENPVYCMAMQPDGKLLIGGAFSTVGGAARGHLARLDGAGVADPTFVIDAPDNHVTSLAVQPNGEVVFGGYFTTVGSTARSHLARVSSTGVLDAGFDPAVTGSQVSALVVQPDGKILVGGAFSHVGPDARSHLARLNPSGTLDLGFDPTPNNVIGSLALQGDGKILVAGDFTTLHPGGVGAAISLFKNARLLADGSVDATYNQDADAYTYGVALQADGQTLLGGSFASIRGLPRHHFASFPNDPAPQELGNTTHSRVQWLRGGTSPETHDVTFEVSTDSGATFTLLGHGNRIYGGWELTGLSLPSRGLLRARARTTGGAWNASGGLVETVVPVTTIVEDLDPEVAGGSVYATVMQPDGKTIIAGGFTSVHGMARHNVARLNADGSLDMGFDPSPNALTYCAAVQPDGKILIGGAFTTIQPNGFPTPIVMGHLARLNPDGTLDESFVDPTVAYYPNPGGDVTSIIVQPDGVILLAGTFNYINGAYHHGLARINADGTMNPFDANITGSLVYLTGMVLQPDGKIVIAGYFDAVGGQPRPGLARVAADGTLDTDFAPVLPAGQVLCLAQERDGSLLVGGAFSASVGGTYFPNLMRFKASGEADLSLFCHPNAPVTTLAAQADEKILIGGQFTSIFSPSFPAIAARQRFARLEKNGAVDMRFINPDIDAQVLSVALRPDGRIWLGGSFTTVDGKARNCLALMGNDAASGTLAKTGPDRLEWLRGATAPEASGVIFELSTDAGLTYSMLGQGTRIAGGWELTGLTLPSSGRIRGRARTQGSFGGGSSSLAESLYEIGPPIISHSLGAGFADWAAAHLPAASAAERAFGADPDHDSLPNGVEYYLGRDPAVTTAMPASPTFSPAGITLQYTRAAGFAALDATAVQWSTDLATWSSDGVTTEVLGPAGPAHEKVRMFIPSAGNRMFFRFAMSQ